MQCYDIKADTYFYPVLIKSTGKASILFHAYVVKLGHSQDHFVRNAIMGMYAKHGPIEFGRELFDKVSDRTAADWNMMITWYRKWGNEEEASRLFHTMDETEKNVITWTTMVTGYANIRDLNSARMYFDQMPDRNTVSWNAMLSGYAQTGEAEEALRL